MSWEKYIVSVLFFSSVNYFQLLTQRDKVKWRQSLFLMSAHPRLCSYRLYIFNRDFENSEIICFLDFSLKQTFLRFFFLVWLTSVWQTNKEVMFSVLKKKMDIFQLSMILIEVQLISFYSFSKFHLQFPKWTLSTLKRVFWERRRLVSKIFKDEVPFCMWSYCTYMYW